MESVVHEIHGSTKAFFDTTFIDHVHHNEVLQDDRLSPVQKRKLLSAWISDACAVDSRPGFRWLPGTPGPILVDHVLKTLRGLDDLEGKRGQATNGPGGDSQRIVDADPRNVAGTNPC